jgi:hypothetical protein
MSKAGVWSSSEKPPIWKSDLHRLVVGDDDPEVAPHGEIHRRHGDGDDQRQLRGLAEELNVATAQEVPAGNAEHEHRCGRQADKDDVDERPDREAVREELPDARQLRAPVDDLGADRSLHPRVRHDDEQRREPGPEREEPDRRKMDALREPVPAEDPESEERRLEEEGCESLDRERCAEDVADELGVDGPVHSELELLHEPGRDADREVDEHERPEEAGEPEPGLVPAAVPERLHDRDERRKAERQRDEEEVVERRRRELEPRQIDSRNCERGHGRHHFTELRDLEAAFPG